MYLKHKLVLLGFILGLMSVGVFNVGMNTFGQSTLEERVAGLETKLQKYENFFTFGTTPDNIKYVMTQGRVGVMTDYWAKKPYGQGAALSVGTITDRFAIYAENEAVHAGNPAAVGLYVSVPVPNPSQRNIAIEAHSANSGIANIVIHADGVGIELADGITSWKIGKLNGLIKQLWP